MFIRGCEDPDLEARVVVAHPLPGVRAGSALLRVGKRLLAVQDDAFEVAWIELPGLEVSRLVLKGGGVPLPKKAKPDFEAAVQAPDGLVYVLGSGSLENRRTLARIDPTACTVSLRESPGLYDCVARALELRDGPNIEGAVVDGDRLRLFHRGSGRSSSASVDVPVRVLDGGPLQVLAAHRFDLGEIDGIPLTITDAAATAGDRTMFVAAAEDTPDAIADGPVVGAAIGVFAGDRSRPSARWARLIEADGRPSRRKIEGLVVDPGARSGWLLTDPDDPERPSVLCRIALEGFRRR